MKKIFFGTLMISLIGSTAFAICSDPLKNQDLCYKMRVLRSNIDLLEAQRDLMQVNYDFMKVVGEDMVSVADKALKDNPDAHVEALIGVKTEAEHLIKDSGYKSPDALGTANRLKNQCLACHSNESPSSGYTWESLSKVSWDKIFPYCNTKENPYLCKSMHGMRTGLSYYLFSSDAGHESFQSTAYVAKEIRRIAEDLRDKDVRQRDHDPELFDGVARDSKEIEDLALAQDVGAFAKTKAFSSSCMRCHGQ